MGKVHVVSVVKSLLISLRRMLTQNTALSVTENLTFKTVKIANQTAICCAHVYLVTCGALMHIAILYHHISQRSE